MTSQCPELLELETARSQPAGGPVRQHLDHCSRCQASLLALDSFREEDCLAGDLDQESLQPAHLAHADRKLSAYIESLAATSRQPSAPRWLLSMAAVLVAAVGLWLTVPMLQDMQRPGAPVMRGGEVEPTSRQLVLTRVERLPDGNLQLAWNPVPRATGYQVVFWNDKLLESARLPVVTGTVQLVDRKMIPAAAEGRFFCVMALRNGKELFRSKIAAVPLPEWE